MMYESKYAIGDTVYLKTDSDQHKRLLIGINIRSTGAMYELAHGTTSSWHYDFEIAEEQDVIIKTNS